MIAYERKLSMMPSKTTFDRAEVSNFFGIFSSSPGCDGDSRSAEAKIEDFFSFFFQRQFSESHFSFTPAGNYTDKTKYLLPMLSRLKLAVLQA